MEKINLISTVYTLAKYRFRIFKIVFFTSIVALGISLILPKYYESSAIIYPPAVESGFNLPIGGLGAIAGNLMGGGTGYQLPVLATPSDVWVTMLKSNVMAIHLLKKFNLFEYYGRNDTVPLLKAFGTDFRVEIGREGTIKISFEKENDPRGAYEIVDEAIKFLDTLNQKRDVTIASNKRLFIENRLKEAEKELKTAEENLIQFQKANNLIALTEQTQALILNLSSLISNLTLYKIELSAIEDQFSGSNSATFQLKRKILETENIISKIYSKSDSTIWENRFLPSFENIPELGAQYLRLFRDVKIAEILYELLVQQYERERINEIRNTPSIQILDPPFVPDYKSRPKRAIIILIAMILSFFTAMISVFISEYKIVLKNDNPDLYSQMEEIKNCLKSDFGKVLFWKKK